MPQNLNSGQVYALRFVIDGRGMPRSFDPPLDWKLDKLNICLTSGLQPYTFKPTNCESDPGNKKGINEFLPSYPFVLYKLGEFNFFGEDWACAEIFLPFLPMETSISCSFIQNQ